MIISKVWIIRYYSRNDGNDDHQCIIVTIMGNWWEITRNSQEIREMMVRLSRKWWNCDRNDGIDIGSLYIWGSPASINGGRWKLWEAVNKWGIYKRSMGFPQFFTAKSCEFWSLIEVAISKLWKLWKNLMGYDFHFLYIGDLPESTLGMI